MNHVVDEPQCGKMVAISNINTKVISTKSNIKRDSNSRTKFVPPTLEEVQAYCESRTSDVDPKKFFEYYDEGGWFAGCCDIKDGDICSEDYERESYKGKEIIDEIRSITEG